MLASIILAIHVAIILFNLFWLVAIPVGAWRRWAFVKQFWWRMAHLASMSIVAGQALAGRACFLTIWQDELSGSGLHGNAPPLIMRWVNSVVFWPLPLWVFAAAYCALLGYVLALLWLVPPRLLVTPVSNSL
jgi:hypothetical protein